MTNALKCHLWRREPATLTHAAHAVTQLTKWTGGGNDPYFQMLKKEWRPEMATEKKTPPFLQTQNGKDRPRCRQRGGYFALSVRRLEDFLNYRNRGPARRVDHDTGYRQRKYHPSSVRLLEEIFLQLSEPRSAPACFPRYA